MLRLLTHGLRYEKICAFFVLGGMDGRMCLSDREMEMEMEFMQLTIESILVSSLEID